MIFGLNLLLLLALPIAGYLGLSYLSDSEKTKEGIATLASIAVFTLFIYVVLANTKNLKPGGALISFAIAAVMAIMTYLGIKKVTTGEERSEWDYGTVTEMIERQESVRKAIIIGLVVMSVAAIAVWGLKK